MKWFGESWGAPVCTPETHGERPELPCERCKLSFGEADQGVAMPGVDADGRVCEVSYHIACFRASLLTDAQMDAILDASGPLAFIRTRTPRENR